MKWVLVFWIFECSGLDCPVPEYEEREFSSEEDCAWALDVWVRSSTKYEIHRGICVEGGVKD